MQAANQNLRRRVNRARNFPKNTCPASRHLHMIGEALIAGRKYHQIDEEPEHVGSSILSVVESLFKARTEIDALRARLGMPSRTEFELSASRAEFTQGATR